MRPPDARNVRRERAPHSSATSAAGRAGQIQEKVASGEGFAEAEARMAEVKFDCCCMTQREAAVAAAPEAVTPAQPNIIARKRSALRRRSMRARRGVIARLAAKTEAPVAHANVNFAGSSAMERGISVAAEAILARPSGEKADEAKEAQRFAKAMDEWAHAE